MINILTSHPAGDAQSAHEQFNNTDANQPELTHELLGSAAAFAGMKAWEAKQRKEGKPVEHSVAKELLAAAAGFEVDRLAETKGADFVDREKAKHHAKKQAMELYEQQYGGKDEWHP